VKNVGKGNDIHAFNSTSKVKLWNMVVVLFLLTSLYQYFNHLHLSNLFAGPKMKNAKIVKFLFLMWIISFFSVLNLNALEEIKKTKYDYNVSIAAIFCDEAPYLQEWIEYHKLIGVDHFYLYNNLSTDNYREVLEPYIQNGEVDLIDWPYKAGNWGDWDRIQVEAYSNVLELARYTSKWLALIDIDEFIVIANENKLTRFLEKYEGKSEGGICLMWSFFGTSNVKKIPADKLLIESLIYHSGPAANGDVSQIWNQGSYKSIIRPEFVYGIISPHFGLYVYGKTHFMVSYDLAHINHYWTRDEYYFNNFKIPRREFWGLSSDSARGWAAGMNKWTDKNPILRFVNDLRAQIGLPIE
jgi:hypothetical protein